MRLRRRNHQMSHRTQCIQWCIVAATAAAAAVQASRAVLVEARVVAVVAVVVVAAADGCRTRTHIRCSHTRRPKPQVASIELDGCTACC